MRPFALLALLALAGCGPKSGSKSAKDNFDADAKSGPDGKRSTAQKIELNKPHTDEVSYAGQDRTDWYVVELQGAHQGSVLGTFVNWDNDKSDINVDVFDAFGSQITASPVRGKGEKQKKLYTPIEQSGTYYIRVTAPGKGDGSVYTMEAHWEGAPPPISTPPPAEPPPAEDKVDKPRHKAHEPRPPREKPAGEIVEARVVSAYREAGSFMLNIDKGSSAGIKIGDTGTVLAGASGEDAVDGGQFKIVRIIDANHSVGAASLRSLGKNNRVAITLGR